MADPKEYISNSRPFRIYDALLSMILVLLFKIPLLATLVSTIVAAGWVTAWIFHMHAAARDNPTNNDDQTGNAIVYPCENSRQMAGRNGC